MWRPGKGQFLIGVKNLLPIRPAATASQHGPLRGRAVRRIRNGTRATPSCRHASGVILIQIDAPLSSCLSRSRQALRRGNTADVERCPHCGGVIRVRQAVGERARDVVNAWLAERGDEP